MDNVLFSVDWPYESNRSAAEWFKDLPLANSDLEKLAHLNAERVLHL